ncbi:hypothetical protein GF351_05145 [Candidatus Woesearchaeota archaeon]|nr:hypothetical protein [Candidatus Woesearchaeota archaeon]
MTDKRLLSVLPGKLHAMAYLPEGDGHMLLKEPGEDEFTGIDELAEEVSSAYGEPEAEDLRRSNIAINTLKEWDEEFHDSGKYSSIAGWLQENGYRKPQRPVLYSACNTMNEAAAWTAPGTGILGVHPHTYDMLRSYIADRYGLSIDESIELILTHEYFHNAQDTYLLENGTETVVESDVEAMLVRYFVHKAANSEMKEEEASYRRLAKAAAQRYSNISRDQRLQELVERYDSGEISEEDFMEESEKIYSCNSCSDLESRADEDPGHYAPEKGPDHDSYRRQEQDGRQDYTEKKEQCGDEEDEGSEESIEEESSPEDS